MAILFQITNKKENHQHHPMELINFRTQVMMGLIQQFLKIKLGLRAVTLLKTNKIINCKLRLIKMHYWPTK